MQVSKIYVYPIKSLGGFSPDSAIALRRGFENDRRWMLVNQNGEFISQREFRVLAQFYAEVDRDNLVIGQHGSDEKLVIEEATSVEKPALTVQLWKDTFHARSLGRKVDQMVSEFLNISCRLVYMGPQDVRSIDQVSSGEVSFADGFPYLIANSASVKDLSDKHGSPITMDRFRPNIVVDGNIPWEEDQWKKITIDETVFEIVKPCARCQVPGVDQSTGEINESILKTLAAQRRHGNKILFGVNALLEDGIPTLIQVSDGVEIN